MAATRAPLNDDRGSPAIVAPSWSKQLFQAEPAAGGQVVVVSFADWWTRLLTGGLTLSAAKLRTLREHLASDLGTDPQKIFFRGVVSGVWRFFFVRTTIVASLDGQQDVQCSKVHLLAERS